MPTIVADAGFQGDYLEATKSSKDIDLRSTGRARGPTSRASCSRRPTRCGPGRRRRARQRAAPRLRAELQEGGPRLRQEEEPDALRRPHHRLDGPARGPGEEEMPLVAAVIYNRLSRGEPLGIDATTRYETNNWTDEITQAQLDKNTPYNTRLNAGLTPTPIGNPGPGRDQGRRPSGQGELPLLRGRTRGRVPPPTPSPPARTSSTSWSPSTTRRAPQRASHPPAEGDRRP